MSRVTAARVQAAISLLLYCALGVAVVWFGWLEHCDRSGSFYQGGGELQQQRMLVLGNARFDQHLAERYAEMNPELQVKALQAAADVNSFDSTIWIQLGLAQEHRGQFAEAEQALRTAAKVDQQYLPAWTLANFYFRRQDANRFWKWAARAAALHPADPGPLLGLADRMAGDAALVLDRLGGTPEMERAYLDLLMQSPNLERISAVVRRLALRHDVEDRGKLVAVTNLFLAAKCEKEALETWNSISRISRLDPGEGVVLTNGDFSLPPSGEGFDWQAANAPGVGYQWKDSRLLFRFSGREPEVFALLSQWVPLHPFRRYRVALDYSVSEWGSHDGSTGLFWEMNGRESPALQSQQTHIEWTLAPRSERLPLLRLVYRRPVGTPRATGVLALRRVKIQAL